MTSEPYAIGALKSISGKCLYDIQTNEGLMHWKCLLTVAALLDIDLSTGFVDKRNVEFCQTYLLFSF